jgi:hypothetical protein
MPQNEYIERWTKQHGKRHVPPKYPFHSTPTNNPEDWTTTSDCENARLVKATKLPKMRRNSPAFAPNSTRRNVITRRYR